MNRSNYDRSTTPSNKSNLPSIFGSVKGKVVNLNSSYEIHAELSVSAIVTDESKRQMRGIY